jgi:hypothetical protein
MLEVLAEVGDTDETAKRIAVEYDRPPDEIARDLAELLAALAERSLVEFGDESGT